MAKKRADTTKVANELRNSAFFKGKAADAEVAPNRRTPEYPHSRAGEQANTRIPDQPHTRTPEQVNTRTDAHSNTRTVAQANTRTPERPLRRASFDLHFDQVEEMRRRSVIAQLDGQMFSMSEMVRTALDEYFRAHPREET